MERRRALIAALCVLGAGELAYAQELTIGIPDSVIGDGATAVPVIVSSTARQTKDLPVADVAVLECNGAATLAATSSAAPAVLAPFVAAPKTIECKAKFRGKESPFRVALRPPAAGLYASVTSAVRSTQGQLELRVVAWDGKRAAPARSLHAAASEGEVAVQGDRIVVRIAGNAPRLVAIAFSDGVRSGAVFVPVIGETTLPVETDALSTIDVWVAGRWFGPVTAKGKLAEVPLQVPPGVTHVVTRSTNANGYVTHVVTDLKIPPRPRIAVLAITAKPAPAQPMPIAIALAGVDGRPAPTNTKLGATATRGAIPEPRARTSGLWTTVYTAPTEAGADRLTITIAGDATVNAELPLEVGGGLAARIEVELPRDPVEPGADFRAPVRIYDAANNLLDIPVTATFGGGSLSIDNGALLGAVPQQVPASGRVSLVVAAGPLSKTFELTTRLVPARASFDSDFDGRDAYVDVAVRDRFGNIVPQSEFEIAVASGGTLQSFAPAGAAYRAHVRALAGAISATLVVRANGRAIGSHRVQFEPPAGAFLIGAWAVGGLMHNLGELATPRAAVGLALRRRVWELELALHAGVEGTTAQHSGTVMAPGMTFEATSKLDLLAFPTLLRARVPLGNRVGVALGAGVVPMRVRITTDGTERDRSLATVVGVRGQFLGDVRLGPGRLVAGIVFGRAKLADASAFGQLDGAGAFAGYEWWFGAFGM